jgi:two-component system, response regulator / RNA-binding antiterminator
MKVLLIDSNASRAHRLSDALELASHTVRACRDDAVAIAEAVSGQCPDAIVVSSDSPSRDTLESIALASQRLSNLDGEGNGSAAPIMLYQPTNAEHEQAGPHETNVDIITTDAQTHQQLERTVSAYIRADIEPSAIAPLLQLMVQRYTVERELRTQLAQAKGELEDRKIIDRAKAIIMQTRQLSEPDAYKLMRTMAMQRSKRLVDIARSVIDTSELLNLTGQ